MLTCSHHILFRATFEQSGHRALLKEQYFLTALKTTVFTGRGCAFALVARLADFLAIYVRMNIGFVNLCVYRQGMCQIFSLFTLE